MQWEQVEYFDNKIICDLVEEKHQGILAVLVREQPPSPPSRNTSTTAHSLI